MVSGLYPGPATTSVSSYLKCGSFRLGSEQATQSLREPFSRSRSGGSGGPVNPVGFSGNSIRLPAFKDSTPGLVKDQEGAGTLGPPGRSQLASPVVVHGSSVVVRNERPKVPLIPDLLVL